MHWGVIVHNLSCSCNIWIESVSAKPLESIFWEDWPSATIAVIRGKSIISLISPCLYCMLAALYVACFPSKWHDSWTRATLLVCFGLVLTTNRPLKSTTTYTETPQHKRKTQPLESHDDPLTLCGYFKNDVSPKKTSASKSRCKSY